MPQLSQKVRDALNEQINMELSSAYAYLSMSASCDEMSLPGAAVWLRLQGQEENAHATKLIEYMSNRGGGVTFKALPQPPAQFGSLLDVFEKVAEHEARVTAAINELFALAVTEKDYATQGFLQWFISEQVEEERSPAEIISMLRLAGNSGSGLLMVDRRLAERARA